MRNVFLGKVRLHQGEIIFRLKVTLKTSAGGGSIYVVPRVKSD